MSIPTIYCDKKHALPYEEITVIASIGIGEWEFPNATIGVDIIIDSGTIYDNVLTFHTTKNFDPLIVSFLVIDNVIQNGTKWTDSVTINVLADYWTTPSTGQINSILTGWNFDGRSQRVDQTLSGTASITQVNLTEPSGEYAVELDYRAFTDIQLKVGGQTFELSATNEGPPFAIYPIQHGAGLLNFEVQDATGITWRFTDGTVSTASTINKIVPAGTSYLTVDDFTTTTITSLGTSGNYIGDLSDVPSGVSYIDLENTGVVGDIIELNHITQTIKLSNTAVSGIIPNTTSVTTWVLNNTNFSKVELETSLVNLSVAALSQSLTGGYFECYDNMPTVDTVMGCAALSQLDSLFWTVLVHSNCGPYG